MKRFLCWVSMLLSLVISSAQAADIQGLWKVQATADGSVSDWIMSINDGIIHGSAYWHYQPTSGTHDNIDRVMGTMDGNTVSITRYLSPSVLAGKIQTFTGTVSGTNISGTWAGTGCSSSSCPWTATITPLATASTGNCNCPPPTVCPTPPACPVECPIITGECTATYNADTGRFIAPCVAVPVIEPFVGKKTLNYSIEMQQRTGVYTFDLDLTKVEQH